MSNELQAVDLPKDLILTDIEGLILQKVAAGNPPKLVAKELGLPSNAVLRVLAKDGVSEYLSTLIDARNQALKAYLPDLLSNIIQAKIEKINDDPDSTMADASKKDVAEIVKILSDLIKVSDSTKKDEDNTGFGAFYQQINVLQGGNE